MARLSFRARASETGRLPVGRAARGGAAGLDRRARTADLAGVLVLLDRERVVALRLGDDGEALGAVRGDRDLSGVAAQVEPGVGQLGVVVALRVVLLVRVARLDLRDGVTSV